MIVAIDGPAASGKGTLARKLAAHLGLPHLDTGLLYRATARALMEQGCDLADKEAAIAAAREDLQDRWKPSVELGRCLSAGPGLSPCAAKQSTAAGAPHSPPQDGSWI
jgi:cytidylate kinase